MSSQPSGEVSSHGNVLESAKHPPTTIIPNVQTVTTEKEQMTTPSVAKSPKADVLAILRRASMEVHHDENENVSSNPVAVVDKGDVPAITAKSSGTVPPKVQIVITEEMAAEQDADSMLKAMGITPKAIPAKGILKSNLTTASSDEEINVHAKPSHSPDRGTSHPTLFNPNHPFK